VIINYIITMVLFLSLFVYMPLIVGRKHQGKKHLVWYVTLLVIGTMKSIIYLMILISFDILI